eukprot:6684463-Pyramimonas_sp.AAC.1
MHPSILTSEGGLSSGAALVSQYSNSFSDIPLDSSGIAFPRAMWVARIGRHGCTSVKSLSTHWGGGS